MRITPTDQPALARLVQEAATRLGVPEPRRTVLGADAEVRATVTPWGSRLVIGLPAVLGLDRTELAAVVEHELLALAAAPTFVAQARYRRWTRAMDIVAAYEPDEVPPRLPSAVVRRLQPHAAPIEATADNAPADSAVLDSADLGSAGSYSAGRDSAGSYGAGPVSAGPDSAGLVTRARAWIRLGRVDREFLDYCMTLRDALTRFGGLRYRITDLHERWPRTLSDEAVWSDEEAEVGRRHPGLARAAATLVGTTLPPADPLAPAPLNRRRQRQLSAEVLSDNGYVPWRTLATVPPKFWQRAAAREAKPVADDVARVLGRAAHDSVEAADVIRSRPADVADCPAEDLDVPEFQSHAWLLLTEAALLASRSGGWTRTHPAVPGVLSNATGARLDLRELTAEAAADPFAYVKLRALLAP